jgi:tetratricopeptide (TPR) repeat protein
MHTDIALAKIVALINEASQLGLQRDYPQAFEVYIKAVQQSRGLARSRLVAVLLNRMGDTLQAQGEVQEAIFAYKVALQTLDINDDDPLNLDAILQRLSQVSEGFYTTPEAIPDLYSATSPESLDTNEQDPTLAIKLWLNLGNAYLRQPQVTAAREAYETALRDPAIQSHLLLTAYATANIGEIHRRQRQLDLAETLLQRALQLFEQAGQPLEKRRALAFMAALKRNRQLPQESEQLFQEALALYDQAQDSIGKAKTLAGLARLYLEQRRLAQAWQGYLQAQTLAKTYNDREVLGYCAWGFGCYYQATKQLPQAIAAFQESLKFIQLREQDLLSDASKVSWIDSTKDVFDRLLTAHLDLAQQPGGNYQVALAVAESARGRVLQELMSNQQRRQPQRQTGATPTPMPPSEPPAIPRLVFHVLSDRTAIFAVTAAGQISGYVSPLGAQELEQRVAQLRRALQVDGAARGVKRKLDVVSPPEPVGEPPPPLATLLQTIYTDLIAPVAPALPTDGTPVLLEPHGVLWLVPFAALQLADGQWLGDCWPLVYAPSKQTFDEICREPSYTSLADSRVLVVGNPIMPKLTTQDGVDISLEPLSGAEAEANAIAKLLGERPHTLLIQADATESAVKALAQSHNIIHLATHGIAYTDDPLASFIAFSPTATENGLLTAREVASNRNLPADLVVLSACQTGLGRVSGDGMLGLSRAYLIAGARTVVVSQWSVNDQATAELMLAFYQQYLESGHTAIALQKAMQTVRDLPQYQHPSCWAAFMVVGGYP